jgi:hypothetical protein
MLIFSVVATTWSPATTPLPTLAATIRPHTILLLLLLTTPSPPTRPLMLLRLTLPPNSTTTHPPQCPTPPATLQSGNDSVNLDTCQLLFNEIHVLAVMLLSLTTLRPMPPRLATRPTHRTTLPLTPNEQRNHRL